MQQVPFTQKDTGSARARGNLGITLSDKVARGRARQIIVMITVSGERGVINNINKEPQQKVD